MPASEIRVCPNNFEKPEIRDQAFAFGLAPSAVLARSLSLLQLYWRSAFCVQSTKMRNPFIQLTKLKRFGHVFIHAGMQALPLFIFHGMWPSWQ